MATPPALELRGIVKRFPGVLAVGGVDFDVRPGEIHALLGENGAGKSTLLSVAGGLYHPDAGEVRLAGTALRLGDPEDALARGLGMVHQHFMLVPTLTVAENLALGARPARPLVDLAAVTARARETMAAHGLGVDLGARIWQLSVGEQQRVEILRVLDRGAQVLVLDEPTAVLTPAEAADLAKTLRRLAASGRAVVFISHKLEEVLALADRITVLRHGRVVAAGRAAGACDAAGLAQLMVGRTPEPLRPAPGPAPGPAVLEARDLETRGDRGPLAVRGVSLTVRGGEIVAVAGVAGNGQRELCEVLTGLRPATAGTVVVGGRDLTGAGPRTFVDAGVAHVPEDRGACGVAPGLSVADNLALKAYRRPASRRRGLLDRAALRARAARLVRDFDLQPPDVDAPAGGLSGGNLQKLILARELDEEPRVLVAVQPTRGLDVGATETVHRLLRRARDRGAGVLLVSADLDEVRALADRILVMFRGRVTGELAGAGADLERLGLLMGGAEAPAP